MTVFFVSVVFITILFIVGIYFAIKQISAAEAVRRNKFFADKSLSFDKNIHEFDNLYVNKSYIISAHDNKQYYYIASMQWGYIDGLRVDYSKEFFNSSVIVNPNSLNSMLPVMKASKSYSLTNDFSLN